MNRLLMFVFSRKSKVGSIEASEIHAVRPFFVFICFFPLGCVQRELKIYAE